MNLKRRLIYIPGLLADQGEESILSERDAVVLEGHPDVIRTRPGSEKELSLLGMNPTQFPLAAGPLMIAALGKEPPGRSVQFHLSLAGIDAEGILRRPTVPNASESRIIAELLPKLSTKTLTVVPGSDLDSGLVWENGSLDLGCTPIESALGARYQTVLPEGDGERILRRLIDDSVNLFLELDFNKERLDKGLVPINICWPWGPGFPVSLPNFQIRYGAPISVIGSSLRSKGIASLLNAKFYPLSPNGQMPADLPPHGIELIFIDSIQAARSAGRVEKIEEFWTLIKKQMILPILDSAKKDSLEMIGLLATSKSRTFAFGLAWNSPKITAGGVPFGERVLDDAPATQRRDFEWFFEHFYQSLAQD